MKKCILIYLLALTGQFHLYDNAYAVPLTSCTNIGISAGEYTTTGTTTNICAACTNKTVADANALITSSGDAVLFKAGETFNIGTEGNRLVPHTGVLYGRYDVGSNPKIVATGVTFTVSFRGIIDIDNIDNIVIDGIDIDDGTNFGLMSRDSDNITVSNLTISNVDGCGLCFIRGVNVTADKVVGVAIDGNPHESLTIDNVDTYVISNSRFTGNGHAAINNKGNARNGEVFGSEFAQTTSDPLFYMERAENLNIHDNWIHTTVGQNKPLMSVGIEDFGSQATQYNRNIEIHNNVMEGGFHTGIKNWIKNTVTTSETQLIHNINFHHNSVISPNGEGTTFWHGYSTSDNRVIPNTADWTSNVIQNNIIWDTGNSNGINHQFGTGVGYTTSFNLYETGETGSLGTNIITTGTAPFVDAANFDYDPAGAAIGAGSDGSNVGATVNWTCGLGTDPDPGPTLIPLQTAKPEPYTIDNLETHDPDHLWVFSDESPAGTIADEGGGTACNLVLTGPDAASDSFGKYYAFIAANSDIAFSSSCTPPVTTGVMCAIFRQPGAPIADQTVMSFGEAADATRINAMNIVLGNGNPRSAIIPDSGLPGNQNIGPWEATDNAVNMICTRQSATVNEIWMNGSGWQPTSGTWAAATWTDSDQVGVGAQFRTATTQYLDGDLYNAFIFNSDKTSAEMATLWNSGDPWAQIGIDPTAGGEPLVPAVNEKLKIYQGNSND